jgi:hypothetical protein
VDHSARHANFLTKGHKLFDKSMFDFMDSKVRELLKVDALVELPDGIKPDVLTR